MATSQVGFLTLFDHNVQSWKVYRGRLTQWFIANNITAGTDETGVKRRAILLSALADGTYQLATDLALPKEVQNVPFEDIVSLLDKHFIPKRSGFGDRSTFYSATQQYEESHTQWAARLRGLTAHCSFSNVEEALRDRFIMGMLPGPEKEKLFTQDIAELTLAKAVELAEAMRGARAAAAAAAAPAPATVSGELYKIVQTTSRNGKSAEKCTVCGRVNHSASKCRYANYKCKKCNKKGHLQRMCGNVNYMECENVDECGDDETPKEVEKIMNQERHYNFVQEVKKVLSFTNAVPFKVKSGRYYCAYCYTTIDSFDHPVDLRVHTHEHERERLDRLDQILRPQFVNETLRVDVDLLQCKVCSIPLQNWNDVFVHLNETHDVQLDQAYTKLIPYRLNGQTVFCALCDEEFPSFLYLDAHMNAHYCNYMCSECGDTFVTETRLKHHLLTHNTGKYPCNYCGKVFSLDKYKKKHEGMVHKEAKLFKCIDCSEAFHSEFERHVHVVGNHKERVRISTCELCGKSYDWKPYYLAHMRKAHSKVKKNVCKYCGKGFVTKHDLSMHEQRHTGKGKHVCVICEKNFVTMTELKKHFNKHVKEIQYVDKKELQDCEMDDNIQELDGSEKKEES